MAEQKLWARAEVRRGGLHGGSLLVYFPVEIKYNFGEMYHVAIVHITPQFLNNPWVRGIVINFCGMDYNIHSVEPQFHISIPNYNHKQEAGYLLNFVSGDGIGHANCIHCGTRRFLHDLIDGECTPCRHQKLADIEIEPILTESGMSVSLKDKLEGDGFIERARNPDYQRGETNETIP